MNNRMSNTNRWGAQSNSKTVTINETALLTLFISCFSGLYLVRDLMGVYFPDLVFSGICAAAFFLLSDGAALGMYIFTTALTVPHNEIMLLYTIVFCLKQLKGGGVRFHKGMFLMVICLVVLQMVDMTLFSKSGWTTMLYDYMTLMLYIIIPLLWYKVDITPNQYKNSMFCYIWGVLLGTCIVVVLTAKQVGWSELFTGNQFMRLGMTEKENVIGMRTSYNANQLSGMMAIIVSMVVVLMERKKLNVLLGFAVCGIAIVTVALTKSRTGLICTGGAILLYVAHTFFVSRRIARGSAFIVVIIGIIAFLLYIEPELFSGIMSRFEGQEDITNGRFDLFSAYMEEWMGNPWSFLFGYGIKSFQDVVTSFNVPHNAIADTLISWGITGFILVAGSLSIFYVQSSRKLPSKVKFLASAPFIIALIITMGGQYLTTGFSHTRLCFLLVSMQAFADEGMEEMCCG